MLRRPITANGTAAMAEAVLEGAAVVVAVGEGEVADTVRVGGTGEATFLMGLTGDESRGWLQQGFSNRNIFSSEER